LRRTHHNGGRSASTQEGANMTTFLYVVTAADQWTLNDGTPLILADLPTAELAKVANAFLAAAGGAGRCFGRNTCPARSRA
jgi:hypothetical protein